MDVAASTNLARSLSGGETCRGGTPVLIVVVVTSLVAGVVHISVTLFRLRRRREVVSGLAYHVDKSLRNGFGPQPRSLSL